MIRALLLTTLLLAGCASDHQMDARKPAEVPPQSPAPRLVAPPAGAATGQDSLTLIGTSAAPPAGSGIGKDDSGAGMYGLSGNGRTVVFCMDASASMVDAFPFVIRELKDAIGKLSPSQRFDIIFFQAGGVLEVPVPNRGMKKASPENIRRVAEWISAGNMNVVPRGATDPRSAIKLALGFKPDLMVILSGNITGEGRERIDPKQIIDLIDQTKADLKSMTRINTIQFLYPDPQGTMKKIAERSNGRYRFVDESDK